MLLQRLSSLVIITEAKPFPMINLSRHSCAVVLAAKSNLQLGILNLPAHNSEALLQAVSNQCPKARISAHELSIWKM
jgi:hypothetical protein